MGAGLEADQLNFGHLTFEMFIRLPDGAMEKVIGNMYVSSGKGTGLVDNFGSFVMSV